MTDFNAFLPAPRDVVDAVPRQLLGTHSAKQILDGSLSISGRRVLSFGGAELAYVDAHPACLLSIHGLQGAADFLVTESELRDFALWLLNSVRLEAEARSIDERKIDETPPQMMPR